MPTMKVQVSVELTAEQVAWFVREADCIGCTFEEAVDIHCNEAMAELVEKYSAKKSAHKVDEAVVGATN